MEKPFACAGDFYIPCLEAGLKVSCRPGKATKMKAKVSSLISALKSANAACSQLPIPKGADDALSTAY